MTEERKPEIPDRAPKQPITPDLKAPPGKEDGAEAAKLADKVHANA